MLIFIPRTVVIGATAGVTPALVALTMESDVNQMEHVIAFSVVAMMALYVLNHVCLDRSLVASRQVASSNLAPHKGRTSASGASSRSHIVSHVLIGKSAQTICRLSLQ